MYVRLPAGESEAMTSSPPSDSALSEPSTWLGNVIVGSWAIVQLSFTVATQASPILPISQTKIELNQ